MRRQILAVFVGIALTAAIFTPVLYKNNQAFAQVTAESRVLQAILGLTDQIKQQTTETKAKYQDIIFDLNLKKKFYSLEFDTEDLPADFGPSSVTDVTEIDIEVLTCPSDTEGACAFNVESVQLVDSGSSANVTAIEVLDNDRIVSIAEKQITTPTNLLVDTGIGRFASSGELANEFEERDSGFEILFDENAPFNGTVIITGEKPQGMELCITLNNGEAGNCPFASVSQ